MSRKINHYSIINISIFPLTKQVIFYETQMPVIFDIYLASKIKERNVDYPITSLFYTILNSKFKRIFVLYISFLY